MYSLNTPLAAVSGIGPKVAAALALYQITTVKDFLLWLPLRYVDRTQQAEIDNIPLNEVITLEATVLSTSNYYKGRRSIQSAVIVDGTGQLKAMWFNNRFIIDKLKKGKSFLFSGKVNDRRMLVQPVVEDIKEETIHTNRLVPHYSKLGELKQGSLRRLFKHILDGLNDDPESNNPLEQLQSLKTALTQLHFPDTAEAVISARERLAIEELLTLMATSKKIKQHWAATKKAAAIPTSGVEMVLPFELTAGQQTSLEQIMQDIHQTIPMNRLLIGDVGSGKTVVAGQAALHTQQAGFSSALIAPTELLAEQHLKTFTNIFPDLPCVLLTGSTSKKFVPADQPTLYIGTHAILNHLTSITPALIIFDEQHRFGVRHRSLFSEESIWPAAHYPHILTMTATPIPRSLMLTVFSHLSLSVIDELPKGRIATKSWVVPESKRAASYNWLQKEVVITDTVEDQSQKQQAFIICPFIDQSESEGLAKVAAANEMFESIKNIYADAEPAPSVGLLHGRMKKKEQAAVAKELYAKEIDILVTTPIVEVGIDLPAASIIIIEAAERFGLASLHQLRGRVGRAGQQGYCLLFTNSRNEDTTKRLLQFCEITSGMKLAELDLQRRGAGDIFGTQQHGFDELRFGNWANVELIATARKVFEELPADSEWVSLLFGSTTDERENASPLAN
ncbi:MAG: ATP-dependent DNA helicase RecG [bacterium]|nr:ATP-dependent DNA helicase RecG [bacterium]